MKVCKIEAADNDLTCNFNSPAFILTASRAAGKFRTALWPGPGSKIKRAGHRFCDNAMLLSVAVTALRGGARPSCH